MASFKFDCRHLMLADNTELQEALNVARNLSWKNFGKRIRFYTPSFVSYKTKHFCSPPGAFPSISVTGSSCALKCKHCGGKVLRNMIPVLTPQELFNTCSRLRDNGALGCLISGGCLPDGSVPLNDFVDAIARIKYDLGLTVIVHTGIINYQMAQRLKKAGVNAALIDIVGSDTTINEVYNLQVKVEDYDRTLKVLSRSGIPTVPHVLVGLHYGKLKGELRALEMIAKYKPSAVVIIALIPIPKTPLTNVDPPVPSDVAKVMVAARLMMPKTPVALGCMRPKGKHKIRTDELAVASGINAIAFPTQATIRMAESIGLEVVFSSMCCSQIFEDIVANTARSEHA